LLQSTRLICPTGNFPNSLSSPIGKNISFLDLVETVLLIRYPALTRGAYRDRHGRWCGMRWTLIAPLTKALAADGEVVWF
jgi:hypothetical protein